MRAELPPQPDPPIGDELICVHHEDGSVEELRLHDYSRLYSLPGVYEAIVQERLGCRSPAHIAGLLAGAVDAAGWRRGDVRVIDVAAGNGVSGEALAAVGLAPVLGTDIVPAARDAALRDRPGLYGDYRTLDLLALSPENRSSIAQLRANALACVACVGDLAGELPTQALAAIVTLLADEAIIAYMHDPRGAEDAAPDVISRLGADVRELARERYLHRHTVNGGRFELDAVVLSVRAQA